jgi:hypothetical protein
VLDYNNFRIRKITSDGAVSTFAGGGGGNLPGYGTNVSLGNFSIPMAIDHSNALWFVEYIYSGTFSLVRASYDGYLSMTNLNVAYNAVGGLCVDSGDNIYFTDQSANRIYRYHQNGVLEVFAGSGNSGSVDGNGIFTSFSTPTVLTADNADNIYVWDSGNHLIRRINQNRDVTTVAGHQGISDTDGTGTNASFYGISAMCSDAFGNIYLACFSFPSGSSIRRMDAMTNVTTVAGSFVQNGYTNGLGSAARFSQTKGICFSQGSIFVTDSSNQRIRQITFDPSEQPVTDSNLNLRLYPGLQLNGVVGRSYRIESSADMTTWQTAATILLTRNPYPWIDESVTKQKKFYRAILLP